MNPFDVAVIAILVVSALFAFVRGFLKEALSILVWIGAGIIAYVAYPYALPLALRLTTEVWLAQAGTGIVLFIVALVILAILSSTLTARIRGTALGPIDRLLGLVYGLARGAVIVCLVYIGVTSIIPELADRPVWFNNARSLPMLARGAVVLDSVLPSRARSLATDTIDAGRSVVDPASTVGGSRPILPATPPPAPAAAPVTTPPPGTSNLTESERLMRPPPPTAPPPPEKPSYRTDDRKAMDRTFQSVQ